MQELNSIADEMDSLLPHFRNGGGFAGQFLPTRQAAHFSELLIEARDLIKGELGLANDFSLNLFSRANAVTGGPSPYSVQEAAAIIRAAARAVGRKHRGSASVVTSARQYVDVTRISALQTLQSSKWDFTRLIELCRELNVAASNGCHLSTAMLLRTILNHVPPVLGFTSFAEVASNYGGLQNRSFKSNMTRLQSSLRAIADTHLHSKIRASEDLPTAVQVDFSADLDVLLGEIIRVAKLQ